MNRDALQAPSQTDALICIVDQDAHVRYELRRLLATLSLRVRTFNNASSFLSEVSGLPLACVISELDLPDMSGVDLLHALAAHGIDVPTILMAADSDVSTAVDAMHAGAVDFLEKPFVDRELLRRVRRIIYRRLLN